MHGEATAAMVTDDCWGSDRQTGFLVHITMTTVNWSGCVLKSCVDTVQWRRASHSIVTGQHFMRSSVGAVCWSAV